MHPYGRVVIDACSGNLSMYIHYGVHVPTAKLIKQLIFGKFFCGKRYNIVIVLIYFNGDG